MINFVKKHKKMAKIVKNSKTVGIITKPPFFATFWQKTLWFLENVKKRSFSSKTLRKNARFSCFFQNRQKTPFFQVAPESIPKKSPF